MSANTKIECVSFTSSEDFLLAWTSPSMFDVLFLDIKMSTLSGLELARIVRGISDNISIVFVTAYSEYAVDGYSVDASCYLLKPVSKDMFFDCMNKVICKIGRTQNKPFLIEKGGTTIKLYLEEIYYFEARSHFLVVYSSKGTVEYRARISELDQTLKPEDNFCRIHRSFLVNPAHVREMNRTEVLMENGDRLPVSRSYTREAYNEYIKYSSRK
ncbi:MAG: LytR/AlgR family response regulator transcription factor [Raoultibacter sp.]